MAGIENIVEKLSEFLRGINSNLSFRGILQGFHLVYLMRYKNPPGKLFLLDFESLYFASTVIKVE